MVSRTESVNFALAEQERVTMKKIFKANAAYIKGAASLFDFAGALVETPLRRSVMFCSHRAPAQDWALIGQDMQTAVSTLAEKKKTAHG